MANLGRKEQMISELADMERLNIGPSQPPLALAATLLRVPLSRFTSRVGGGSAR